MARQSKVGWKARRKSGASFKALKRAFHKRPTRLAVSVRSKLLLTQATATFSDTASRVGRSRNFRFMPPLPPSTTARAPARFDVMGGISDYSGGLCLEWPLQIGVSCHLTALDEAKICAQTRVPDGANWDAQVEVSLDELAQISPRNARSKFAGPRAWALYTIGALIVLREQIGWRAPCGLRLTIESNVPHGAGVSSSAALEVATLSALNRAFELELDGHQIARLAQRVENEVVGAPCGIMDQLTVSLGRAGRLLRLKCQPAIVEDWVKPPDGIEFWGIDSGVKHSIGGSAYTRARCAAMMGRAVLKRLVPAAMRGPDGELYLANISPDVWRALRAQIPAELSGADFLRDYQHLDSATTVEPDAIYPLRLASEHPIYEADRVARFARLLRQMDENPAARLELGRAAGELMVQGHFSYAHRCDLGSDETDMLVELAREAGVNGGIYGAKITGGGAGGTVAILADRTRNDDLESTIESIAARYAELSGRVPQLFRGSSDGANVDARSR